MNDQKPNQKQMAYETFVALKTIQERIDRHSVEWHEGLKTVNAKLDNITETQHKDKEELLKKIQDVEISNLKDSRSTNVKIATLSGVISMIVSLIVGIFRIK